MSFQYYEILSIIGIYYSIIICGYQYKVGKQQGKTGANPYVKKASIMADIFKLYDAIEVGMNKFCRQKNPYAVLEKAGADMVESTVSMSRSLGNDPQSVGKDQNIWKTLYMTVVMEGML